MLRRRIAIAVFNGATWDHLGFWLAGLAAVWLSLMGVVPQFLQTFREPGVTLPALSESLMALSDFACTPGGVGLALIVVLVSLFEFRRHRDRAWLRQTFVALTLATIAFFPVALVALFLALVQTCQKL